MNHGQLHTATQPLTRAKGVAAKARRQPHISAPIGLLKTAVETFDGRVTELYSDAHGLWYVHAL